MQKKGIISTTKTYFGKTVEKLRRKAIGPVKWQPVAKDNQGECCSAMSMALPCLFYVSYRGYPPMETTICDGI